MIQARTTKSGLKGKFFFEMIMTCQIQLKFTESSSDGAMSYFLETYRYGKECIAGYLSLLVWLVVHQLHIQQLQMYLGLHSLFRAMSSLLSKVIQLKFQQAIKK